MPGLDAYRIQLVEAGARLSPRPRRLTRRRGLALALAAILVCAPALAATRPWQPLIGDPKFGPGPKVLASAPPRAELRALSVLRRAQTGRDRSALVQKALRYFGSSQVGIHTGYIRLLGSERDGTAAVLVPAKRWDPAGESGPSRYAKKNPLCVFVPDPFDGGGKSCFTLAEVRAGRATGSGGGIHWGLVPDGVTRVRVTYADAKVVTKPVVDNYYAFGQRGESRDIAWIGRQGQVIRVAGATAPSVAAPKRYRYHGRVISPDEAARRHLACEDSHAICAATGRALERLLGYR